MTKTKVKISFDVTIKPAWALPGEVPTKFALFMYGANETTKGIVNLNKRYADRCVNTWREYGNRLSIDYDHAATNPSGEGTPAAGWLDLYAGVDALYAVSVEWTPRATYLLKNKEYKYYSPWGYIEFDEQGRGWLVEVINCALTNMPATKHQIPLVASRGKSRKRFSMFSQKQIDALKELLIAGGVKEEVASDLILKMMPICHEGDGEAPPMQEPMATPPAAPAVAPEDEKEPDEKAYSKDPIVASLQKQMSEMGKELGQFRKDAAEGVKKSKEELFTQFKKEGKLRYTTDSDARKILEIGENAFRTSFGGVPSLVNQVPPTAPEKKADARVSTLDAGTFVAQVKGASVSHEEIEAHMKQNPKLTYKQAASALSAQFKRY